MSPAAVEAMLPYLTHQFGNPSGGHHESRQARRAVDDVRDRMAAEFDADLGDVVFTAGGTEADNLAVFGAWEGLASPGPDAAIVCSAIEHHAVLHSCRALAARTGAELREVPADKDGMVDLEALAAACTPEVALVSLMTVNNEIGTVQPLDRAVELVRQFAPDAIFHTDAVQAVPWLAADAARAADLVSISAHKFGGPQGVGALVVRNGARLRPVSHGGGQERERRSGTHNVAGIVAMGAALEETGRQRPEVVERVTRLRDRLADGLLSAVTGSVETGVRRQRVAGILHLRFAGVESESLVLLLDEAGVSVSAGAACSSGAVEVSHVLSAMGLGRAEASSGIRLSLGSTTTSAEIERALAVVPGAVAQLRD